MFETSCESSTSSTYYVGLDVHQKRSSICILDRDGKQVKRLEVKGSWAQVVDAVAQVPGPFSVCYEASCGYGYLYERLSPLALARHVAVAHPGQLRLIYGSKRKNDRVDAAKLAKLLYLDMVPQVHVPRADVRAWRALITYRHKLMSKRVAVKNQIRAPCCAGWGSRPCPPSGYGAGKEWRGSGNRSCRSPTPCGGTCRSRNWRR